MTSVNIEFTLAEYQDYLNLKSSFEILKEEREKNHKESVFNLQSRCEVENQLKKEVHSLENEIKFIKEDVVRISGRSKTLILNLKKTCKNNYEENETLKKENKALKKTNIAPSHIYNICLENETLKAENKDLKDTIRGGVMEARYEGELFDENEKLKEENKKNKDFITHKMEMERKYIDTAFWSCDDDLIKENEKFKKKIRRLEKRLEDASTWTICYKDWKEHCCDSEDESCFTTSDEEEGIDLDGMIMPNIAKLLPKLESDLFPQFKKNE